MQRYSFLLQLRIRMIGGIPMKNWIGPVLILPLLGYFILASALIATEAQTAGDKNLAKATFAGGCFWCMEPPFDKPDGVISTTSGYTGGQMKNPSYEEVSSGITGHAESVQVVFDPAKIRYSQLLDVFWHNIDPLTLDA